MFSRGRIPNSLKKGPLYTVMDNSCTIVTVVGYGNVLNTIFPITLFVLDTMYHRIQSAAIERFSLVTAFMPW